MNAYKLHKCPQCWPCLMFIRLPLQSQLQQEPRSWFGAMAFISAAIPFTLLDTKSKPRHLRANSVKISRNAEPGQFESPVVLHCRQNKGRTSSTKSGEAGSGRKSCGCQILLVSFRIGRTLDARTGSIDWTTSKRSLEIL